MEGFEQWFGAVVAICLGIMILAVFFWTAGRIRSWLMPGTFVKLNIDGLIKNAKPTTVILTRGETLENVRIAGIANREKLAQKLPYPLSQMVVLQAEDGSHILINPKAIRLIRQPAESQQTTSGKC